MSLYNDPGLYNYGSRCALVLADYVAPHKVDHLYRRPSEWARQAILNVAGMGHFSADRTILEYADDIWGVKPIF